jgi:hypothetical protein
MPTLTEPLAAGPMLVGGKQDAYSRILNWEAVMTMRRGKSRLIRYRQAYEYYSGENMKPEEYVQPLEINYLRATCEAHASYLWGQWEPQGRILNWSVAAKVGKGDKDKISEIEQWLYGLFSGSEELLYAAGMNQSIYGDCILIPRYDPIREEIRPESVLPEYFHCKWSSHDVTDLREVIISYPIDRQEAEEQYSTRGDPLYSVSSGYATRFAIYWEHWTREKVEVYIDNRKVDEYPNPYSDKDLPGLIPFIHIPNVRSGGEFYGSSDIEAVYALQDELNRKMGDTGDIISYAAHPIILVKNYFGKVTQLPIGPDAIWDMGREGTAEYLSGGKPPVDIEKYIDKLLEIIQDLAYMPAAAFGRSETAQASALALAMEMMPVTQRVNWKRLHWKQGLINYAHIAARLAEKEGILPFARKDLTRYTFEPNFAPVLPKDRASTILENVSLVSSGLRTVKRALDDLGERDSARQALEVLDELREKLAMGMAVQIGGKNQRGPGGSPDTGAEQRDQKKIASEGTSS